MQADIATASVSGPPLHFMSVGCSLLRMGEILFGIIRRVIRARHSASSRTDHRHRAPSSMPTTTATCHLPKPKTLTNYSRDSDRQVRPGDGRMARNPHH